MEPLFPEIPQDLTKLDDEQLAAALSAHQEAVRKIQANDEEFLAGRDGAATLEALKAGAEEIKSIKAELAARAEAVETYNAEVAAIASEVADEPEALANEDDPDPDDPADPDPDAVEVVAEGDTVETDVTVEVETEVVAEPELVTASADVVRRVQRPAPARPSGRHLPRVVDNEGPRAGVLLASAGLRGIDAGQPISRLELADAMIEQARIHPTAAPGTKVQVVVASAQYQYPEDRQIVDGDPGGNMERVTRALPEYMTPEALTAAGGLCAPGTPIYDLPLLAVADEPVWDSLPKFQADRGAITFPTPIGLADVAGAVTFWSAATDEDPGTLTKGCLEIDCDPFLTAEVAAISACVTWGNMGSRAWPERVANVADLVAAYHARVAETALLDAFGAESTVTTDEAKYGAVASLLQGVIKAAAEYRSRNRMRKDAMLQVYLPQWIPDLLLADLAVSQFDRFHAVNQIVQYLGNARVSPVFYMDTETDDGQILAAQADGALNEFPTTVVWYLFAPGTWLALDMGRLDLGIVRDSTLNATNDLQTFYEVFRGIGKTGVESIKVTSTICPNGSTSGPTTIFTC